MRIWLALLIVTIAFSSFGCGKKSAQKDEDPVLKAYKLIDQDRAEEAVLLMEEEHNKDPKDRRTTIALASAHTSLAGLQVYSFFELLEQTVLNKPITKGGSQDNALTPPKLELTGDDSKKSRTLIAYLIKYLTYIDRIINFYEKIPGVSGEQRAHLETAIALLETINPQEKSDGLFKAVLRIVYFKHQLSNDISRGMFKVGGDDSCDIDLTGFNDNVWLTLVSLERILSDLIVAFPAREEDYNKSIAAAKDMAQQLLSASTTAEIFGNAGVEVLLEFFKQQSPLGAQLKCGS